MACLTKWHHFKPWGDSFPGFPDLLKFWQICNSDLVCTFWTNHKITYMMTSGKKMLQPQTWSEQSCIHSLLQHACKILMCLFSCLGFMLIAFNVFIFIAPSGPRGIQSRRSSNGSLAWRETSSGRKKLLFSLLKIQPRRRNYSSSYSVSHQICAARERTCRRIVLQSRHSLHQMNF